VLKKLGICPEQIDFAEHLSAEAPLVNYVCHGVRFESHVLVLEYDFAVVEFFKKSSQIALFLHRSEDL